MVRGDLGVSVPYEDIGAHGGPETLGGQMVPNVGAANLVP